MADPITLDDPSILIGAVQLKCHSSKVSLTAEDKYVDVSTFCNPDGEKPSTKTWTGMLTILQSFDTTGAWQQLIALADGTPKTVVLKPKDAAVAATNPSATFEAYVSTPAFLDAEVGEPTTYDIELKVVGAPVFAYAAA